MNYKCYIHCMKTISKCERMFYKGRSESPAFTSILSALMDENLHALALLLNHGEFRAARQYVYGSYSLQAREEFFPVH